MEQPIDFETAIATFVIPHWTPDFQQGRAHLETTLAGIFKQTDPGWQIILIDDASPDLAARAYLRWLEEKHTGQIEIIFNDINQGAGLCRNQGIEWASKQNSPFILFNDADDISYPHRLAKVRRVFANQPGTGVVYSTFAVIDQAGAAVSLAEMAPSVAEVLEAHRLHPLQGDDVWIDIGTKTGYINHTSSTAVRTDLASQFPFPAERVSEDAHTWFRYSAGGGAFAYIDEVLSTYRTTRDEAGSSSRLREGGKQGFYATKARVDAAGFRQAIELAIKRKTIRAEDIGELLVKFYVKLGETLAREGELLLATAQIEAARCISVPLTEQQLAIKGIAAQPWVVAGLPD